MCVRTFMLTKSFLPLKILNLRTMNQMALKLISMSAVTRVNKSNPTTHSPFHKHQGNTFLPWPHRKVHAKISTRTAQAFTSQRARHLCAIRGPSITPPSK